MTLTFDLLTLNSCRTWRVTWPTLSPNLKTLRLFIHELRVIISIWGNAPFSHFDLWMTFDLEKGHLPCKDFPKLFSCEQDSSYAYWKSINDFCCNYFEVFDIFIRLIVLSRQGDGDMKEDAAQSHQQQQHTVANPHPSQLVSPWEHPHRHKSPR